MSKRILSLAAALSFLLFASVQAFASDWTVGNTTSNVKYTTDKKTWRNLSSGMQLPNKSWIDTGPRGRVTLRRGPNTINLNPGTLAGVFDLGGPLDKTVVAQQSGKVALDVVRKSAPWMTVKTPYLAAIVKGTKFDVSIKGKKAEVSVVRGIVEVTDSKRGERVDITAGQSVSVDKSGRQAMDVSGAGAAEPVQLNNIKKAGSASTETETETESESKSKSGNSNSSSNSNKKESDDNDSDDDNESGSNSNSNSGGNGNGNSGNKDKDKDKSDKSEGNSNDDDSGDDDDDDDD